MGKRRHGSRKRVHDRGTPTKKSLARLKPHIRKACRGTLREHGAFRCNTRAAIVKAYEFAMHAQRDEMEPFFAMATLRGICEDLIVLSFLESHAERDEVVNALAIAQMTEVADKQRVFFEEQRAWQPVLGFAEETRAKAKLDLESVSTRSGWGKKLPTVKQMAERGGQVALYDYLYAATSKLVHFSPSILMRLGWSVAASRTTDDRTEWVFSTKNFTLYYRDFNKFYSAYLLSALCRRFLDEFEARRRVDKILTKLDERLACLLRWPEALTYEEMNAEPPGVILRILARVAAEREGQGTDSANRRSG